MADASAYIADTIGALVDLPLAAGHCSTSSQQRRQPAVLRAEGIGDVQVALHADGGAVIH